MDNYYSMSDLVMFERMEVHAADMAEREKRRPRETKHDTTAFYNFRKKKKKSKNR